MDIMIKKGFQSVPILQINDKFMNYNEAIKWVINQ